MSSSDVKYIGLDVHTEATTVAVRNGAGKLNHGIDRRNQSQNFGRSLRWIARRATCDVGRGYLGGLAL